MWRGSFRIPVTSVVSRASATRASARRMANNAAALLSVPSSVRSASSLSSASSAVLKYACPRAFATAVEPRNPKFGSVTDEDIRYFKETVGLGEQGVVTDSDALKVPLHFSLSIDAHSSCR